MSTISLQRAAIVGATGPTGWHLAAALRKTGVAVRVISRSRDHLLQRFPDTAVEKATADVVQGGADLSATLAGCDVVFDCIGLPPDRMDQHPIAARHLVASLRETGGRCVKVASFWSFLPAVRLPLTESHPRSGGPLWSRWRREAEDILRDAGAAIVNLPDFYGPQVHTSVLQQPLREAVEGATMNWIGGLDTPHEFALVPDAMTAVARLATAPGAYGHNWIFPGAGAITGREVAAIARHVLERNVKIRAAGPLLLRFAGLFNAGLRSFMPMVPDYVKPITYDATHLIDLIGVTPTTPYDTGIAQTLQWLKEQPAPAH